MSANGYMAALFSVCLFLSVAGTWTLLWLYNGGTP